MTTQTIRPALPRRSESGARHRTINEAAGVLLNAMHNGCHTPTSLAIALDLAGLLTGSEPDAEITRLRGELAKALLRAAEADVRAEATRPADEDPIAYALTDQADGITRHLAPVQALRKAPAPMTAPAPPDRVSRLLDAIRTHRGEWTTHKVMEVYRAFNIPAPKRSTARSDLRLLHAMGHLVLTEDTGRRFYTLKTRKDNA